MQPVGLCGVPFRELQEQAAVEISGQAASRLESAGEEEQPDLEHQQTQLWVEKYKPR